MKLSARGQFIFCLWLMCTTFSHKFKNITQNGQNQSCDTIALKRRHVLVAKNIKRDGFTAFTKPAPTSFGPPRIFFQRRKQRGQHQFHSVGGKFTHDRSSGIFSSRSHMVVIVAKTHEQVGKNMHNVGLKQLAKHVAQLLKAEQSTLSEFVVLLVLRERTLGSVNFMFFFF